VRRLQFVKIFEEVLVRKHEQEFQATVERLDAVSNQKSSIVTVP